MADIEKRKQDHVRICLDVDVETETPGFDRFRLVPESFPELSWDEVDSEAEFLGWKLSFPFVIASMSGGSGRGPDLNRVLAAAAQDCRVGLALGSLRPALDNPRHLQEYDVRGVAPEIPICGNIGVWQLRDRGLRAEVARLSEYLRLDGVFVHVNPAQELVQPEGDRDFGGALDALGEFVQALDKPVLVKEVGTGLATRHVARLVDAGVAGFDVSGRGGTNFVLVEAQRRETVEAAALVGPLSRFGLPTAEALVRLAAQLGPQRTGRPLLLASGGVRRADQMAIAVALGADVCAAARPILQAAMGGARAVVELIETWREAFHALMLLTGSPSVEGMRGRAERVG